MHQTLGTCDAVIAVSRQSCFCGEALEQNSTVGFICARLRIIDYIVKHERQQYGLQSKVSMDRM